MAILKKKDDGKMCCCCGKEFKLSSSAGLFIKAAATSYMGKDVEAIKQEYLLDPKGKGIGKDMFYIIRKQGDDASNDDKGNAVYNFKAGDRCLCEKCCESVLYSMLGEPVNMLKFVTYPKAKFDILYSKLAEMDIEDLKERSHKLEEDVKEVKKKIKKQEEDEINEWASSLK